MYANLIKECYEVSEQGESQTGVGQQANEDIDGIEEDSFDDLDDVPLAELVNTIVAESNVDLDKTMDYTVFIDEQNISDPTELSGLSTESCCAYSCVTSNISPEVSGYHIMITRDKG